MNGIVLVLTEEQVNELLDYLLAAQVSIDERCGDPVPCEDFEALIRDQISCQSLVKERHRKIFNPRFTR